MAPNNIATAPIPPVDTPNASSSHVPEITKTDRPAIAVVAEPTITSHARNVNGVAVVRGSGTGADRSTRSRRGAGTWAGNVTATSTAASAQAIATATNGPRHPNRLISTATIGAPANSAIAQEVSYRPSERARRR